MDRTNYGMQMRMDARADAKALPGDGFWFDHNELHHFYGNEHPLNIIPVCGEQTNQRAELSAIIACIQHDADCTFAQTVATRSMG